VRGFAGYPGVKCRKEIAIATFTMILASGGATSEDFSKEGKL